MSGRPAPRVLITGGRGQLARALAELLERRGEGEGTWAPGREELDVTDRDSLAGGLARHRPDWIVHCAAWTAVDAAEADPAGAARVNDAAVGILADLAAERGARIIHVSTDYVFDGLLDRPYLEEDATSPVNVYGLTKRKGEERLLAHPARSAIVRAAWLYGDSGRSFLTRILDRGREALSKGEALPVVADQVGSPTDVQTFAEQILALMEASAEGLFHAGAQGSASWLDFAAEIFARAGIRPRLTPIAGESLGRPARRPPRVVLENRRLRSAGLERMIPWREGVARAIGRRQGPPRGPAKDG